MLRITDAVKHLIIINIIMFIAPQALNIDLTNIFAYHFPENENFRVWQFFTSMFLHADWQHLIFNMFALWMFGTALEELLGTKKFLFLYLSAGVGAAFIKTGIFYIQFNSIYDQLINLGLYADNVQDILNTGRYNDKIITLSNKTMSNFYNLYHTPSIGASGAIFGLLASYATYFPNRETFIFPIPFPIKSVVLVTCLVASDLFLGAFSLPGDTVGRFAHVGGAIIGFIVARNWKKNN